MPLVPCPSCRQESFYLFQPPLEECRFCGAPIASTGTESDGPAVSAATEPANDDAPWAVKISHPNCFVVECGGRLEHDSVDPVIELIESIEPSSPIVVDLAHCESVDATSLEPLLRSNTAKGRRGGYFALAGTDGPIGGLLDSVDVSRELVRFPDVNIALANIGGVVGAAAPSGA